MRVKITVFGEGAYQMVPGYPDDCFSVGIRRGIDVMDAFNPAFFWILPSHSHPITQCLVGNTETAATFFCRDVLISKSFGIQDIRLTVLVTAVPHGAKDIPDTLQLPGDIF